MRKKLIFVLVSLATIIILIIVAIYIDRKGSGEPKPSPTSSGGKLTLQEGSLKEKVFFPSMSQDGKSFFYLGDQGVKIKKFSFDSQKVENLYGHEVFFTIQAYWSPDKNWVILKNNDDKAATPSRLYDLKNGTATEIDPHIQNILWGPDSQKIYYQYLDIKTNQNFLATGQPDGSGREKIVDLQYDNYGLFWVNNYQSIGFWSIPSDIGGTNLKSVNIKERTIKEIVTDYSLGNALASPDGSYIAYEKFNPQESNYTVALSRSDGNNATDTGIQSSIGKIAWLDKTTLIIVARKDNGRTDSFYKVNVENVQKTEIGYEPQTGIDAQNLILSDKTLYFTSNDILYSLTL